MSKNHTNHSEYDDLLRLYELYTNVQLEAETIYHNRSNLLLVCEGLLFVALPAVLATKLPLFSQLVTAVGTWLSLMWVVLEQRQLIHHRSREEDVLVPLQEDIVRAAEREGRGFRPFWRAPRPWVAANAKWYQRHSLRTIIRLYIPGTFLVCWTWLIYLFILCIVTLKQSDSFTVRRCAGPRFPKPYPSSPPRVRRPVNHQAFRANRSAEPRDTVHAHRNLSRCPMHQAKQCWPVHRR